MAWAKARTPGSTTDWLVFRQLSNKCFSLFKKAKSGYYLPVPTENLNDLRRFWKTVKSLSVSKNVQAVPTFVMKDSVAIYDKMEILNCLNEHFISSGSLFDSDCSFSVKPYTDALAYTGQCFNFAPFSVQKVHKALKMLDPRKTPGPDLIDPYFLKLAADFIAEPLAFLFNLAVENKEIPRIWKTSFILPLLKGSEPAFFFKITTSLHLIYQYWLKFLKVL